MKKILVVIAATTLGTLIGCGGMSAVRCQQTVVEELKGWEVVKCPSHNYMFVARDPEGNIWWVETMNTQDTKITAKVLILPAAKR